ncbi:MAG TPA: NINE protein [Gemmatimonadales bacterium]|nr:NINE protein [Gemmatimonadales bacterium]
MKDKTNAYLLWCGCFLGVCGLQRIYSGKYGTGFLWLFTVGLLGIGQLVDLFLIPGMVEDANNRLLVQSAGTAALLGAGAGHALGRLPRTTEEFQVALVRAASAHGGRLSVAEAVVATGRGFKEVDRQLREMALAGYIEADSDEGGQVYYVFPGLVK